MSKTYSAKSKSLVSIGACLLMLVAAPTGWSVTIADTPLFLAVTVPPNVIVTLDDSGSMKRAYVPDTCGGGGDDCSTLDNRYMKSSNGNPLYYNPAVTYPRGRRADGTYIATSFNAALNDGFDSTLGTVNLENNYRPTAYFNHGDPSVVTHGYMGHFSTDAQCSGVGGFCQIKNPAGAWVSGATVCVGATSAARNTFCRGAATGTSPGVADSVPGGVPAYYYVFDRTRALCDGTKTDNDCYRIVLVNSTSGPGSTDERQNFANWYSFARTRNLATETAASLAFYDMDANMRVAWQGINSCFGAAGLVDTDCDGYKNNFTNVSNALKPFNTQHRLNFYNWIGQQSTRNSTPLPAAMQRAGQYLRTTGENSPYDNDFSTSSSGQYSCRRNYHIMMTDGIWNSGVTVGNIDNSTVTLPVSDSNPVPTYTPRAPYRGSDSSTLADVAMFYALTDLAPSLTNNLLPIYRDQTSDPVSNFWNPVNDPYTWQHMVNFTIGLGLTDFLSAAGLTWTGNMYGGSYTALSNGTLAWPTASTAGGPGNVADLWHAAINSRGQFFSADNPDALSTAFRNTLVAINSGSGSSAALSTNSTSIQPGTTVVYQAKFSDTWTGSLLALPIDLAGTVLAPVWDASRMIPRWDQRKIYTHDGSRGTRFDGCGRLSGAQRSLLDVDIFGINDGQCDRRLDWLRGNPGDEQRNGGTFRNRPTTVMGDVINSDPAYVKDINYGYSSLPSGTPGRDTYSDYVRNNGSREAMVYVGANDGMLHAIRGTDGAEEFAYVPLGVYPNLSKLTAPSYMHKFYVDGGITVGDAYLGGAWKTVLVAGLNAGGRTVYALDVTDPGNVDESDVMWEFYDSDLGMTYSQPQVGILENNRWVAVFGNGYNSPNGGSYLYVVDLESGALLKKIVASDTAGNEGNGLSTPLLYDSDGNHKIDAVYAGDLLGHLWKFDFSGGMASWGVAFAGQPLFTARYGGGTIVQPITSQPKAARHTSGPNNHIVLFGTGQYLAAADVTNGAVQTFYGILDDQINPITALDRSTLQVQTIDLQAVGFGRDLRAFSGNTPDWGTEHGWYLDLLDKTATGYAAVGERVISTPIVHEDRVIFVTAVPSGDNCTPGGTSWLMELNFLTGGGFDEPILDLHRDGVFDDRDNYNGRVVSGVRQQGLGISKTPVWLQATPDSAFKVMTGTSGGFVSERNRTRVPPGPPGGTSVIRRSWVQIR